MTRPKESTTRKKTDPAKWSAGGKGVLSSAKRPSRDRKLGPATALAGFVSAGRSVPHTPMNQDRKDRFVAILEQVGNYYSAAKLVDGYNSGRTYLIHKVKDVAFAKLCDEAMKNFASRVADALREEAIEGKFEPVINGGGIVIGRDGKEIWLHRRNDKLLAMMARKFDPALREQKSVTSTNLNVNVGATGGIGDPDDPMISIRASECFRLPLEDRETLLRIVGTIMTLRGEGEREQFSIDVPSEFDEAREEAETIEAVNVESDDDDQRYVIPPEGI